MIKNRLMLSLAALCGLLLGTATPASAKSASKLVSNTVLRTVTSSKTVNFTGKAGLYTKASAMKGAKKVLTKTGTAKLAKTADDGYNFNAFRVAKFKNGSVYYKVVSFNHQFTGWIYGGKSKKIFAGGLKAVKTTREATESAKSLADQTTLYQLNKKFVSTNANKAFYEAPAGTKYLTGRKKIKHGIIKSTAPYRNEKFELVATTMASRSKTVWYKLASDNTDINGSWIPAEAIVKVTGTPSETTGNKDTDSTPTSNSQQSASQSSVQSPSTVTGGSSSSTGSIVIGNSGSGGYQPTQPTKTASEAKESGIADFNAGKALDGNYSSDPAIQAEYAASYTKTKGDETSSAYQNGMATAANGATLNSSFSQTPLLQAAYVNGYNLAVQAQKQGQADYVGKKALNSKYSTDPTLQDCYVFGYNFNVPTTSIGLMFSVNGVAQDGAAMWNALTKEQQSLLVANGKRADYKLIGGATSDDVKTGVEKLIDADKLRTITLNGRTLTYQGYKAENFYPGVASTTVYVDYSEGVK